MLSQTGRLKVAQDLPEAEPFVQELLHFRMQIKDTGHDSYDAWREGQHDDLLFAVALACWVGVRCGLTASQWQRRPRQRPRPPGPTTRTRA